MELAPGYLTPEDMPFGPRVFTDGLFEGKAETLVGALGASDGPLSSIQTTIAANVADGLDGKFASTIGAAEHANENNGGQADDQTAGTLVDNGGGVEMYHQSAQSYLPQPDAPIEGNFKEFPNMGDGYKGNGGVGDAPDPGTVSV